MIICHTGKWVFIKTQKTAGSSFEDYMQKFLDPEIDILTEGIEYKGFNWKYTPLMRTKGDKKGMADGHCSLRKAYKEFPDIKEYKIISIERNPWDKSVSSWHFFNHRLGYQGDFETWFWETESLPFDWNMYSVDLDQTNRAAGNDYAVDTMLFYEDLKNGILKLGEELNLPLSYDDFNQFRHKSGIRPEKDDYKTYYSPDLKRVAEFAYRREIKRFDYTFE